MNGWYETHTWGYRVVAHIDIVQHRLHSQHLFGPKFATPAAVVAHFGAVQAQDYLPALWALGLRIEAAAEASVERAIGDRQIVRTWPLRGTIHFVSPADIRWMLELSAPRALRDNARRRELGLDDGVFAQSRKVIAHALQDGQPRPRKTLCQDLDDAGISPAGQRGVHILGRLAQEGVICIGPREGKQQTFVLLDAWVPPAATLERDEALAELARRYFTSHGPATIQDYAWWSGLTLTDARAGLAAVRGELAQAQIDDQVYWFAAAEDGARLSSPVAHLLPVYDEYAVAYRDRSAFLAPAFAARPDSGNGIFRPSILIDGRTVGTWTRTLKNDVVSIAPNLFRHLTGAERDALAAAAGRYGAFLGRRPELVAA